MDGTVKSMLAAVAKIDQDIFPEHLGTMVIINAPVLFRSLWVCIKPFLDERTLVKIKASPGFPCVRACAPAKGQQLSACFLLHACQCTPQRCRCQRHQGLPLAHA